MSKTEHNNFSFGESIRNMVVEDEHDEKKEETVNEASSSSKWKKVTLTCYAVFPVLILAVCMMRLQIIDFSQGKIGYGKVVMHGLMLAYLLCFQSWVAYKYGELLFPRLQRQWVRIKGKLRSAFNM